LVAIVTPGDKVPALAANRVLFDEGVPIAVQTGSDIHFLTDISKRSQWDVRISLLGRRAQSTPVSADSVLQ
jgi:ATP-dependent Lhr-like helicase